MNNSTQVLLKNLLLAKAKKSFHNMPIQGYPQVADVLHKYGPFSLKYGTIVSGKYYQYQSLLIAIKLVSKLKDSHGKVTYDKKSYTIGNLASKVLRALKGCKDLYKTANSNAKIIDYSYLFSDLNGLATDADKDRQLMYIAMPILKTRRKVNQKACSIMHNASYYWTTINSQMSEWNNLYFIDEDGTYHSLTAANVYNFLTKGEPW